MYNYKKILTVREGEVGGGTPPMMTVSGKYGQNSELSPQLLAIIFILPVIAYFVLAVIELTVEPIE